MPSKYQRLRPHGMSLSPANDLLAIAHSSSKQFESGLSLHRIQYKSPRKRSLQLKHVLGTQWLSSGTPKGIAFCPDSTCVAVTLCDADQVVLVDVRWNSLFAKTPKATLIMKPGSRPEDIKFSPDGRVFAVSSSKMSEILFYSFDPTSNTFGRNLPIAQLKSPEARLHFPHGIDFSKDGTVFAVTQFGDVVIAKDDSIKWRSHLPSSEGRILFYRVDP